MEIIPYESFKNEQLKRLLARIPLSGFSNLGSLFDANSFGTYFFRNKPVFIN